MPMGDVHMCTCTSTTCRCTTVHVRMAMWHGARTNAGVREIAACVYDQETHVRNVHSQLHAQKHATIGDVGTRD